MVAENDIGLDSGAAARLDGTRPYAFRLLDSGAVVSDLTIRFVTAGVGLAVEGGAPVISGILHDDTVEGGSLLISGGSSATVRDSDLGDGWIQVSGRSPVTIADSTMFAIVANANGTMLEGAAATFRGNRTHGIFFSGPSVVQGNEVLVREREPGDSVGTSYASGIDVDTGEGWLISDNVVSGFTEDGLGAIRVPPGTAGTISGNTLTGNKVGIAVDADDAVVSGNVLAGGEIGIVVSGAARLEDNDVGGMSVAGISVGNRSTAELSGNRSCDNAQDLRVFRGGQPRLDDSNEICVMPALDG